MMAQLGRRFTGGAKPMRDPLDFVSDVQFQQVYNYCIDVGREREALILRVAFETGRRLCEIAGKAAYKTTTNEGEVKHHAPIPGLRPIDIDAKNGKIVFTIAKKAQIERPSAPFEASPKLCKMLLNYAKKYRVPADERLFGIGERRIQIVISQVFEDAGIPFLGKKRAHVHALRHGAAIDSVRKAENPEDLLVVNKQLAHSTIEQTLHYLQYRTEVAAKNLIRRRFEDPEDSSLPQASANKSSDKKNLSLPSTKYNHSLQARKGREPSPAPQHREQAKQKPQPPGSVSEFLKRTRSACRSKGKASG